jgi:hypothetical protein
MSTLNKLGTSFAKEQLWKQYNKISDPPTTNMDKKELKSHREALRLIQRDLYFSQ